MTAHSAPLSLVADIGGTNTRCALAHGQVVKTDTIRRYSNAEYPGLETVLKHYLADEAAASVQAACVAVAGPVRDGAASMTNLDWTIDKDILARATGASTVSILNDLQAQGHALGDLAADSINTIVSGPSKAPSARAVRLVVGVGTGFNAAPVFETPSGRFVPPSEAGHANLPIRTEQELKLCRYVSSAHGFPAVEDVLSGRGLERVLAFLADEAGTPQELSAKDIMAACANGETNLAVDAVALFIKILGTVCGNLSLIQLPFGGVYLVGGVARAMAPFLKTYGFDEAFRDKGRFAGFMGNFAVHVVEDDYAALTGSASHLYGLQKPVGTT